MKDIFKKITEGAVQINNAWRGTLNFGVWLEGNGAETKAGC
jgi:hypothetical protein